MKQTTIAILVLIGALLLFTMLSSNDGMLPQPAWEAFTSGTVTGPGGETVKYFTDGSGRWAVLHDDTLIYIDDQQHSYTFTLQDTVYISTGGEYNAVYNETEGTIVITDGNGTVVATLKVSSNPPPPPPSPENQTFYGPDGGNAKIIYSDKNGAVVLVTYSSGKQEMYYVQNTASTMNVQKYYGPNGNTASIVYKNGQIYAVKVVTKDGKEYYYYYGNNGGSNGGDGEGAPPPPEPYPYQYPYGNAYKNQYYDYGYNSSGAPPPPPPPTDTSTGTSTTSEVVNNAYDNRDLYVPAGQVMMPVCPRCPPPIIYREGNAGGSGAESAALLPYA